MERLHIALLLKLLFFRICCWFFFSSMLEEGFFCKWEVELLFVFCPLIAQRIRILFLMKNTTKLTLNGAVLWP